MFIRSLHIIYSGHALYSLIEFLMLILLYPSVRNIDKNTKFKERCTLKDNIKLVNNG
jgi:hypothetical protein